jgi:molybdate transport system regulatory protein
MKKRHAAKRKISPVPGYRCHGRIWIEKDGRTFLGYGRVVLLENIRDLGSISKAARAMKMSYKHAWDLINSINRHAVTPLVTTSKGGKGGGGARLTEAGEKAVADFKNLYERLSTFMKEETERL